MPAGITRIHKNAFNKGLSNVIYIFFGGDEKTYLSIVDKDGNDNILPENKKIFYGSANMNNLPRKDWWGFENEDVKKDHHISDYMWNRILGFNIFRRLSSMQWGLGDKVTEEGLCAGL